MYKKYYNLLRILSVGIIALLLNTCGTKVDDYRNLKITDPEGKALGSVDLSPYDEDEKPMGEVKILTLSGEKQTGMNSDESVILKAETAPELGKTAFCSATVTVATWSGDEPSYLDSEWSWQSSDPNIAYPESTITAGSNTITGKKGGTAAITVTGVDSEASASFTVTVNADCDAEWDSESYTWNVTNKDTVVTVDDPYPDDEIECAQMNDGYKKCCMVKGMGVDGDITITATGNKSGLEGTLNMGIGCIVMVEAVDHSGTVNIGKTNAGTTDEIDYNTIPEEGIEYKMVLTNCGNFENYEWTVDDVNCKKADTYIWECTNDDAVQDITINLTPNKDPDNKDPDIATATIKVTADDSSTERRFPITATAYKTVTETMDFDPDNDKKATGYLNVARLLVDKVWVDAHKNDPDFILVYANGKTDKIIPGAILFKPTSELSDSNSVLLPESQLETKIGGIGISRDSNVVVYDNVEGLFGRGDIATYLLWVLDALGHDITKLHLLNGQWRQWKNDGGKTGQAGKATSTYDGTLTPDKFNATADFIKENLYDSNYALLANIGDYATTDYLNNNPLFDFEFSDHHLPCAVQIDFDENLMTQLEGNAPGSGSDWRLNKISDLLALYEGNGATRDKTIITY